MSNLTICPQCRNVVASDATNCSSCGAARGAMSVSVLNPVKFPDSIMISVKRAFERYAVFSGRAGALEYWSYVLALFVAEMALKIVGSIIHLPLTTLLVLGTIVPSYALSSRRMHDIGKSAWNVLWALIPFFGAIYVIYLAVQPSEPRDNQYGAPDRLTGV